MPTLLLPLHVADVLVIVAYLGLTVAIGVWSSRRHAAPGELFLANRSLGPAAVGFSLLAANVSSEGLIGLPGAAYTYGISAANYEWMASLVLVVSALLIYPLLMRARLSTMPEWMERRFSPQMRRYMSGLSLVLSLAMTTPAALYSGALLVTSLVPQLSMLQAALLLALFTAAYTAAGGLRAVVYTDVMQAVVLLGGSAMLAWLVFGEYGHSWARVREAVPASHLSLIRPVGDPGVPWPGLLSGLPVAGLFFWTMNQYEVQRVLGARDLRAATHGAIFAAGLKLLPLFIMILPGALAIPLLPHLANGDQVWPQLVLRFAPVGMVGLMVAALLAALMSTCSATLNSAATLITLDFLVPRRPDLTPERITLIGRMLTLGVAVAAALWAPHIMNFKGLWSYLQTIYVFVVAPMVAVFVVGLITPRLGGRAALYAAIGGHVLSAAAFVASRHHWVLLHFTVLGGLVFVATALMCAAWMVALGDADRPRADSPAVSLIDRRGLPPQPRSAYVLAALVLVAVGGMLTVFW